MPPSKSDGRTGAAAEPEEQPGMAVYTVAPGAPFLETLARAILAGDLPRRGGRAPDPIDLSGITILLPTRRAERALADAFLKASGRTAMLLPRLRSIAERDEELAILAGTAGLAGASGDSALELELPPAIGDLDRVLLLTVLVMRWSEAMRSAGADETGEMGFGPVISAGARSPAQAAAMARDLARLMDLVEREGASLDGLEGLVQGDLSEHWQQTIRFLEIITESFPGILASQGLLTRYARQNRLILAEAERYASAPPAGPVIVAGVTGSIPATLDLMRAVGRLPQGAIVLPGLDLRLDAESFAAISPAARRGTDEPGEGSSGRVAAPPAHPEHPQFGLKRLIEGLGVTREEIGVLDAPAARRASPPARARLVSEAMRPSATTGRWATFAASADREEIHAALAGVSLIEAPTAADEAEAISLILRRAADDPAKTAALITPDRRLARRVAVRLAAWGIRVDDSAGRPFAKTVPGAFLELVIDCAAKDFSPAETIALLKHPLTRLGLPAREVRFAARALELAAFRRIYIGSGIDGMRAALAAAEAEQDERGPVAGPALRHVWPDDWPRAEALIAELERAFAPLTALMLAREPAALQEIAAAHVKVAEALARLPAEELHRAAKDDNDAQLPAPDAAAGTAEKAVDETAAGLDGADPRQAAAPLYVGEAGAAASRFFSGLMSANLAPSLPARDYADLYRGLVQGINVQPNVPTHPRLFIWGPLEARLIDVDIAVLGSLNEGTWPDPADPGPWLNRPMRRQLGLPVPEEETGRAAHDFASFLEAREVIATRAKKVDGVPTVPSRWLMRLQALLAGLDLRDALTARDPWLGWARSRDAAPRVEPARQPRPAPPVAMRPRRLSVSAVERWIANPYAIFAREILRLEPMPMLGASPDAALRGGIIHEAMARFAGRYPAELPVNCADILTAIAGEVLREHADHPRIAAFWVPRFRRFAAWFAETEARRREGCERLLTEVPGRLTIAAPAGEFVLTARADRLDVMGGGIAVTDYKTGSPPTDKEVLSGRRPQLPLEAAIISARGFEGVPVRPVQLLRYIRASGGEPPGEEAIVKCDDIAGLAARALEGLSQLVARFDAPSTPYVAVRRSGFSYDYDDYAQLARVAEWAAGAADGGEASA